jgi:Flp pilus assembly protein TadD
MAEQAFLTASRLDPWNAEYLVLLGQFYKRQGFASRARRHLQRALEIQPGHAKAQEELDGLDPA